MISRRRFLGGLATSAAACRLSRPLRHASAAGSQSAAVSAVQVDSALPGEDLFARIHRLAGRFDETLYRRLLGSANPFREGDAALGLAAANEESRRAAQELVVNTRIRDIDAHPVFSDHLTALLQQTVRPEARRKTEGLTLSELRSLLLTGEETLIREISPGLSSDVIGCVVKLMTSDELITTGARIFHALPGSQIGARGYLGARIQPNSPTDNVDDIRWQVFDGWSYAVGDVLLGTNPVSSNPESVAAVELALRDLLVTFGLQDVLPHCVLSHIDVQAEVEAAYPGSTALWFQSIAGTDGANATFDISVDKMLAHADQRAGRFDLYFETGQGADFTNGHGNGFDMVLHESRKYGFARALKQRVAAAKRGTGQEPWVHLNDVAGFIGPEVFRTREQLVRCCLEDIVMGKLHGLTLGLDVCATLHMDISLEDLDWCLDQILPANPAYLMALPTKIDPMLGYLTTGFQDHVRLREKFGYRVNDRMWEFFQQLGVIDATGSPTQHFGNPIWVYLQYCRRQGDTRSESEILAEGRTQLEAVRRRGVFVAEGHGARPWDLSPGLATDIQRIYSDAKQSIRAEFSEDFVAEVPDAVPVETRSADRSDYILHPPTGERLSDRSVRVIESLRAQYAGRYDAQIVISDGLNALSIMEPDHLSPFLAELRQRLAQAGFRTAPANIVVQSGRVRAGYQTGELLYSGLSGPRAILHVIGERPGTGHRTFSVYITAPDGSVWSEPGRVDHNITKVVSGVAMTALNPRTAAVESVRLLQTMLAAA